MGGVRLQGRPDLCLYVREQCSKECLEGFRFCTLSCTSESVAAFDFSWDRDPTENLVNPKTSSPEFTCTYILVYAPPSHQSTHIFPYNLGRIRGLQKCRALDH